MLNLLNFLHLLIYVFLYIYIYGVDGSVGQPKASILAYKPEVPGSTPDSSCFSLVFIKNLINDKSKHKKKKCYYLFCIVRGSSQLFITCTSL